MACFYFKLKIETCINRFSHDVAQFYQSIQQVGDKMLKTLYEFIDNDNLVEGV